MSSPSTRIPASVGRWDSIYLEFPDRQQYNFMVNLTGIGWTESFGTAVIKNILSPLLIGERGLPWAMPWRAVWEATIDIPQPEMGGNGR